MPTAGFTQLDLLRPADELRAIPGDFDLDNADLGWARKLAEAQAPTAIAYGRRKPTGPSLQDSIRQNGVYWPVEITHRPDGEQAINEGHHRVAAAHDLHPRYLLPVRHRQRKFLGQNGNNA